MAKKLLSMLLALSMMLTVLAACNNEPVDPVENPEDQQQENQAESEVSTPEYGFDDEMTAIIELGLCSVEDKDSFDEDIDAKDFYGLLIESLRLNKIAEPKEAHREELWDGPISRVDAANFIFFIVLENYYGKDTSFEPWNFGAYEYAKSTPEYENRCGQSFACMEHVDMMNGVEDAGWSWGVSYCAMQLDPYSMKPIMELNEENYFRSKDNLTNEEAFRAVYRIYRSFLEVSPEIRDNPVEEPDETVNESEIVDTEFVFDDEMLAIVELGLCYTEDSDSFRGAIDAKEFYELLIESLRLNKIVEPKEAHKDELWDGPISRMDAANFIFFVVLENYFDEDTSLEPWNFGAHEYAKTLDEYVNRCGESFACMEHVDMMNGVEDAGWSWGVSYCAMQLDPYSMRPIMELNEENYFRSKDSLTKEEALRAIYRVYRAYLYSEPLTLDQIEPMVLTAEHQEKAAQMPDAKYNDLPAWRGNQMDNKTFSTWANHTLDMYKREEFEIFNDLGFDFTRLFITHELMFDLTDGVRIESKHLANLDDAIGYAIDNGVHISICLYDFPGFAGASMDDKGFYDADLLENVTEAYEFFAKRYQNVPNSVLSFNLFNEPWLITKDKESYYVDAVHTVSKAIWEYNSERLIFVDGIAGSQEPVQSLAGEPYAQAFHMYEPEQFVYTNWVGQTIWYQDQQWPLPYANGMLDPEKTLTLQGSFSVGTRIEMLLVGCSDGDLSLVADGNVVSSMHFVNGEAGDGKVLTLGTLDTVASELVIKWSGDILQFQSLAVIYPETSEIGVPLLATPWMNLDYGVDKLVYEKMTVIYCDAWCLDGNEGSTLILAEDCTYSNPGQDDLCYDQSYLNDWIQPWIEFRESTGTEIMLQEWGIIDIIAHEGGVAYLEDWVEVLNYYNVPWNCWGVFLNVGQLGVEYEDYRGYKLDRAMVNALMTKNTADILE